MKTKSIIKKILRYSLSIASMLLLGSINDLNASSLIQNTTQQNLQSFTEFKGIIIDVDSKEKLVFAGINVNNTNIRTVSNKEGEFLLKVPNDLLDNMISVSYLGYQTKEVLLKNLNNGTNIITLSISITELSQVTIKKPKSALALVRAALNRKNLNYYNNQTIMTSFYRETIKKGKKNASLSEAVVEVYKQPYETPRRDEINLIKSRKKTNYSRLDTIALKLQGGPFTTLYTDIVKYPEYIFNEDTFEQYDFIYDAPTQINGHKVYVVKFKQSSHVDIPLYYGKLYIDSETYTFVSAVYSLNLQNKQLASELFVRRKPGRVSVLPIEATYRVDYKTTNGKWHYGYSNIQLGFRVKWKKKLFSSTYNLDIEMAITDWIANTTGKTNPKGNLKSSIIFVDEASGFSDPDFWGEYNIIEPEKSIESAIKKIEKQLKRVES